MIKNSPCLVLFDVLGSPSLYAELICYHVMQPNPPGPAARRDGHEAKASQFAPKFLQDATHLIETPSTSRR